MNRAFNPHLCAGSETLRKALEMVVKQLAVYKTLYKLRKRCTERLEDTA